MKWPERLDREPTRRLVRRWAARCAGGKPVLTAITDPDADRPAGLVKSSVPGWCTESTLGR